MHHIFLDPKWKNFPDGKYEDLKTWFDSRLDDAIKAAEIQNGHNNGQNIVAIDDEPLEEDLLNQEGNISMID